MNLISWSFHGLPIALARDAAELSVGALVAGLWQGIFLLSVVWMLLKLAPQMTAAERFAVWIAVFCVAASLPVLEIVFRARLGAGVAAPRPLATAHLSLDPRWSYFAVCVWAAAAIVRMGQFLLQGIELRALWKSAGPVPHESLAGLDCANLWVGRNVQVCTSDRVDRPSVIGFFAPRILLPDWLFPQLSAMELRHIVLHEVEHLRRRDDWINLLQKIALVVFPLNPALLWIDHRLAAERELACDDGVLRTTRMPRAYATSLASVAERRLERRIHRRVVALALGVFGPNGALRGRSEFGRRIESILSRGTLQNSLPESKMAGTFAALFVAAVLGLGLGLARAPQLVSFAPGEPVHSQLASGAVRQATVPSIRNSASSSADSGARMENVSFHLPAKKAAGTLKTSTARFVVSQVSESRPGAPRFLGAVKTGSVKPNPIETFATTPSDKSRPHASQPVIQRDAQWMILTSFDQDAPARVVVKLSDGRFYVAPYAAVPVQDGWLIVQL